MKRIAHKVGEAVERSALLQLVTAPVLMFGLFWSISTYAHWAHSLHCEGARTGKCGWAWCEHYDGSDYLHDFNF